MGKKRSQAVIIFAVIGVICLGITVYLIFDYYRAVQEAEEKMEMLRLQKAAITMDEVEIMGETESGGQEASDSGKEDNPYKDLFLKNEHMAAWLQVEGTVIDYPVMQNKENEDYYIDKDFYGKKDKAGSLILDNDSFLSEPISTNLIIHGHNMKAGTMFGGLEKYKKEEYFREHRYIRLFSKDRVRKYEVMAAFYSQVYLTTDLVFKYYNFFQADNRDEFLYFYDNVKKLALYDTGVKADFGDRFITLSTCSYQTEDGRFVVVAREMEEEEELFTKFQ